MKKSAKIFLCFVMALVLSLTALPAFASASAPNAAAKSNSSCWNSSYTVSSVSAAVRTVSCAKTNTSASNRNVEALYAMVEAANRSIEAAVRIAQLTPYDDVDELLFTVDLIVSQVRFFARSIGAEIACEYTEYYIDGRYVLIDPIRVVNIPGSGGGNGSGNGGK